MKPLQLRLSLVLLLLLLLLLLLPPLLLLDYLQPLLHSLSCNLLFLSALTLTHTPNRAGYAKTAEIVLNISLDALSGDYRGVDMGDIGGGSGHAGGGGGGAVRAARAARAGSDGGSGDAGGAKNRQAKQREQAFLYRARVRSIALALFLNNLAFLGGFCWLHAGVIGRFVDTETIPARWHFALTVGLSAAAAPVLAVISATAMG